MCLRHFFGLDSDQYHRYCTSVVTQRKAEEDSAKQGETVERSSYKDDELRRYSYNSVFNCRSKVVGCLLSKSKYCGLN